MATKKVTWIAQDGTPFETEAQAVKHEKDVDIREEHEKVCCAIDPPMRALYDDGYHKRNSDESESALEDAVVKLVGEAYNNGFADGHAQGTDDEANSSSADTLRDELKATRVRCAQLTEKLRNADSQIACLSVSAFRPTVARDLEFLMTGLRDLFLW